jgi:hypothetical protein
MNLSKFKQRYNLNEKTANKKKNKSKILLKCGNLNEKLVCSQL